MSTSTTLRTVTPSIAVEWLSNRWGEQRAVRESHVTRLVRDMESGRFRVGPDAIVRINGRLANGQHRLSAIVESGIQQTMVVMESSDESMYQVIDCGLRRSARDSLSQHEFSAYLSPIARWVWAYEWFTRRHGDPQRAKSLTMRANTPTHCEIIEYCIDHLAELQDAARVVNPLYEQTRLLTLSLGGAIYVIAVRAGHAPAAEEFLRGVYIDGGATAAGDFRNRLIGRRGRSKPDPLFTFALAVKSIRAFIGGERLGCLKWGRDETFPSIDAARGSIT